jgi:hypothetical protein
MCSTHFPRYVHACKMTSRIDHAEFGLCVVMYRHKLFQMKIFQ